ncbi:MAG: hypothetical protein OEZ22_13055 [Spirochaetia bacterium]|nr:hypothetical protein [Spirochaetia bacterium]
MTSKLIIKFILIIILLSFHFFCANSKNEIHNLTDGWFYRWGDSPVDNNGVPVWIKKSENEWKPMKFPSLPEGRDHHQYLWLKLNTDTYAIVNPAIFIAQVYFSLEAYQNGKIIYRYGDMSKNNYNFPGMRWHLFPLINDMNGENKKQTIYLRIFSPLKDAIGIKIGASLSSKEKQIINIIASDIDRLLIIGILLFLFVLSLSIFIFGKRDKMILIFALTNLTAALNTLNYSFVKDLLYDNPLMWHFIWFASISFLIVEFAIVYEKLSKSFSRKALRIIWQIHGSYAIVVLFLMLSVNYEYWSRLLGLRFYVYGIEIILGSIIVMNDIFKNKDKDVRIFITGFVFFILFAIPDALSDSNLVFTLRHHIHWGILAVISTFGIVLIRRYRALENLEQNFHREVENNIRNERNEIYSDIHDHLGSNLNDTSLTLRSLINGKKANKSTLKKIHTNIQKTILTLRERLSVINDIEKLSDDFTYGLHLILLNRYSNAGRKLNFSYDKEISNILQKPGFEKTRMVLYTIAKEITTNDFKYGNELSKWNLSLQKNKNPEIIIEISNKTLFHSERKSTGLGEKNIYRRVIDLKGTIHQKIENGVFSMNIKIPIKYKKPKIANLGY